MRFDLVDLEGTPSTPHSVGQFGVGMKRALFKLGSKFRIESTTETSRFVVEEDVNEWKARGEWQFHFKELEENLRNVPPEHNVARKLLWLLCIRVLQKILDLTTS